MFFWFGIRLRGAWKWFICSFKNLKKNICLARRFRKFSTHPSDKNSCLRIVQPNVKTRFHHRSCVMILDLHSFFRPPLSTEHVFLYDFKLHFFDTSVSIYRFFFSFKFNSHNSTSSLEHDDSVITICFIFTCWQYVVYINFNMKSHDFGWCLYECPFHSHNRHPRFFVVAVIFSLQIFAWPRPPLIEVKVKFRNQCKKRAWTEIWARLRFLPHFSIVGKLSQVLNCNCGAACGCWCCCYCWTLLQQAMKGSVWKKMPMFLPSRSPALRLIVWRMQTGRLGERSCFFALVWLNSFLAPGCIFYRYGTKTKAIVKLAGKRKKCISIERLFTIN